MPGIEDITAAIDGQAYVDYELLLPTGSVPLMIPCVRFHRALIKESVYTCGETQLTIHTTHTDYVDRVLKALEAKGNPLLRFRVGLGLPGHVVWTPWQLHWVTSYFGTFTGSGAGAGHRLTITTQDMLASMNRSTRTRAHRGKISGIVQRIAEQNGLRNTVVEPTNTDGLWIQSFSGDVDFMRRLAQRARNAQNRGSYLLFVRDNVLHFHTPDYQADVRRLAYYRSSHRRLDLLAQTQQLIGEGAGGACVIGHDPMTGQTESFRSSPDRAVRYANWISRLDKITGLARQHPFHLSENRRLEAANLAQNMYEAARLQSYELKLQVRKTRLLRAGDLLDLDIQQKTGHSSTWQGLWLVVTTQHVVEKNQIVSVYFLQRGELAALKGIPSTLAEQGVPLLEEDQTAPGTDINLQQARASQLTKGSGQAVGTGIYTTVRDPQKRPEPETGAS